MLSAAVGTTASGIVGDPLYFSHRKCLIAVRTVLSELPNFMTDEKVVLSFDETGLEVHEAPVDEGVSSHKHRFHPEREHLF